MVAVTAVVLELITVVVIVAVIVVGVSSNRSDRLSESFIVRRLRTPKKTVAVSTVNTAGDICQECNNDVLLADDYRPKLKIIRNFNVLLATRLRQ